MSGGNVKVAARAKPEGATGKVHWQIHGSQLTRHHDGAVFQLNAVYDTDKSNAFIYLNFVHQFVQKSVNGVNATLFCHGHSDCGKTHTMMGGRSEEGMIQLAANEIFRIKDLNLRDLTIKCEYFQCYLNQVTDLLSKEPKRDIVTKNGIVPSQTVIEKKEDVRDLLVKGRKGRIIKNNGQNLTSSRSHCVFRFFIVNSPEGEATVAEPATKATLTFVDLAGAEPNRATPQSKNIHQGLLDLKILLMSQCHSSNATQLLKMLKNSIGGNSATGFILNFKVSQLEETTRTLELAATVKKIEVNAKQNQLRVTPEAAENAKLRKQLEEEKRRSAHLEEIINRVQGEKEELKNQGRENPTRFLRVPVENEDLRNQGREIRPKARKQLHYGYVQQAPAALPLDPAAPNSENGSSDEDLVSDPNEEMKEERPQLAPAQVRPVPLIRLTAPNGQEDHFNHPPPIPPRRRLLLRAAVAPLPATDQDEVSSDEQTPIPRPRRQPNRVAVPPLPAAPAANRRRQANPDVVAPLQPTNQEDIAVRTPEQERQRKTSPYREPELYKLDNHSHIGRGDKPLGLAHVIRAETKLKSLLDRRPDDADTLKWMEADFLSGGILFDLAEGPEDKHLERTEKMVALIMAQQGTPEPFDGNVIDFPESQFRPELKNRPASPFRPASQLNYHKGTIILTQPGRIDDWIKNFAGKGTLNVAKCYPADSFRIANDDDVIVTTYKTAADDITGDGTLLQHAYRRIVMDNIDISGQSLKTNEFESCLKLGAFTRWALVTRTSIVGKDPKIKTRIFKIVRFLRIDPYDQKVIWDRYIIPKKESTSTNPEEAARRLRQLMMALAPGLHLEETDYWQQAPQP